MEGTSTTMRKLINYDDLSIRKVVLLLQSTLLFIRDIEMNKLEAITSI